MVRARGQWSAPNPGHNEPTYKEHWKIPGGCVEAGESPYTAARREVAEELGLVVMPGRLLVVDWVPPRPGRTEGVMLVFDGGRLAPDQQAGIRLALAELHGWAWCTPAEADARLSPLLARRVRAATQALTATATSYLENGSPPFP
ncbi:NUDIX hydrolase [Plantactinospora sp. ZYX-F-223]|uniref:NUDIX hydrolase n=1 Tax=Plantactinospora sp. ZYX-F-223 TaxID=3144103 RepID=UPI0031FCD94E